MVTGDDFERNCHGGIFRVLSHNLMEATEDLSLCSQPSYQHPETLILQKGGLPTSAQNRVLCEMKMKRVSQSSILFLVAVKNYP